MPDTSVRYDTRKGQVERPIRFLGPDQNFVLKTERISHRLSANIPPRLLDLLEIASAVFCADSTVPRGALTQPRHGETWRRSLDFTFAVRDLAFWHDPDIERLLRGCIEFMTEDRISCEFVQSERPPPIQSYLEYERAADAAFPIDEVILFSGGIDSLTGALEALENTDGRIALVTHRSAQKTVSQQNDLIDALKRDYSDRFLWIPVHVHRKGRRGSESTQRSRSLLFAALGGVVANMLGADRVRFFENGIVSQNLPLARPIVGTLATRTTHPQTLDDLQALLSEVFGGSLAVRNDYQWMTKTEVVAQLKRMSKTALLPLTVSCNHTFKRESDVRHCGACTQCFDRRFAVLANGLGDLDRDDDYATDVLFGTRTGEDEQALAAEWVRHARRLLGYTPEQFQRHFMSEVLRISRPFADRDDAMRSCHEMHVRHGRAVDGVLCGLTEAQIEASPVGSIARTFGRAKSSPAPETPMASAAIEPSLETESITRSGSEDNADLEVVRYSDNRVVLIGLQDFEGVNARLISCLLDALLADRELGKRIKDYTCLNAREIADQLKVPAEYVHTQVTRIRKQLQESWVSIHGAPPPKHPLIKTNGKRGYTLDSRLNHVLPTQLS